MDRFTKVRNIGKGNMGACALARNNEDGKYYVIKQVDLTRMNKKERQQSLNEARVLSSLRHPNVINYVDSFLAKKSDHLCIVMEFADGGDISSRIKKNYGVNFRESQVLDWFIQLVLSLHYVHQRKILHRDVKTQNVFLTSDNVVKLGDFGIARTLSNTYDQAKTFVGTPYYLSPELILERPYDHRSDVWALGVVLYELLTLKHPFNASDMKGLMQRILKVQYDPIPMIYSTEVRNIVSRLLVKDPAQRIELADVLRLPVIQRRMTEWLRSDVVPQKYLDTLVKQKLLPHELLEKAQLLREEQVSVRVKPIHQDEGFSGEHGADAGLSAAAKKHTCCAGTKSSATVAESENSEGEHTKSSARELSLPPVSARHKSPSTAASGEVQTAPPTAYAIPSASRVRQLDRLSPALSPCESPRSNEVPRHQAHHDDRGELPNRRVLRQGGLVGISGGVGGGVAETRGRHPQQRAPMHKHSIKTPTPSIGAAFPLNGARPLNSHPPASLASSGARPSPLPPRLSSLDNFYQQLNFYQQHRSAAPTGGPFSNGYTGYSHNFGVGQPTPSGGSPAPSPPFSARGVGAAPPSHIPVTVLASRKVSRKRSELTPPAHVNPLFRSSNHSHNFGGGGVSSASQPATTEVLSGAPDIKIMLQRAAKERAQRRLGGVV